MDHKFIRDLAVGEKLTEFYLVRSKRNKTTRTNKPFLDLDLADNSGQINAKIWDRADELSALFSRGDVVKVKAKVDEYQGARQLKVTDLRPAVESDDIDMDDLVRQSPYDAKEQLAYLGARIGEVEDEDLKRLLDAFFGDDAFVDGLLSAPAARNIHHAYQGGLIEHTVKVVKVALLAADELYPGQVDRDLIVAGAILHDAGKILELDSGAEVGTTREGYLLGHITLGARMLLERAGGLDGFPEGLLVELEHILISHHGERDWGSPVVPMTPEAMIVHIADNLDAKTQIVLAAIEDDPNADEEFTQYHRTLGRHFFKSPRRKGGEE